MRFRFRRRSIEIDDTGRASLILETPWDGEIVRVSLGEARFVCLSPKDRLAKSFARSLAKFVDAVRFDSRADDQHSFNYAKGMV